MIILAIKTNGNEKLLAIASRLKDGQATEAILCDWNTVPNTLRIFNGVDGNVSRTIQFNRFRDCAKWIFKNSKP